MSRVKEYLALIPIVGTKYVYQRGGGVVNGNFNFPLENLNISELSSGIKDKQAKMNYNKEPKGN